MGRVLLVDIDVINKPTSEENMMNGANDLVARAIGVSRRAEALGAGRVRTARLLLRERRLARRLERIRSELDWLTR
jgi:hypothetical protein